MELKIAQITQPTPIEFNYQELKNEITAKANEYANIVYTDDTIKEAKADKAALNKLKKALNDERIRQEKEYMKPFNDFKTKVNELIGIIEQPIGIIDTQIKEYDKIKEAEKEKQINELWESIEKPEWVRLNAIWNPKWKNVTFSISKIEQEIRDRIEAINTDVHTLESLPAFSFEALSVYKATLDINKSLAEGQRMAEVQRQKEEAEQRRAEELAKQAEVKPEPPIIEALHEAQEEQREETAPAADKPIENPAEWVNFSALLTYENALKLKAFFDENNISFKKI
jgi:hypothetical protein